MENKIIIAIDGLSSTGKSTLAKALANKLLYLHLDTGAMYRAVTYYFLKAQIDWTKEAEVTAALNDIEISFLREVKTFTLLNGENVESQIRSMEVSQNVSPVSAIPIVREVIVDQQRLIGRDKGIVIEGRDIGTVVFPEAELKIFLTAEKHIRAQRRYKELIEKGQDIQLEEVIENLESRDVMDSTRAISPFKKADDAINLDNTDLNLQEQLQTVYVWAKDAIRMKAN